MAAANYHGRTAAEIAAALGKAKRQGDGWVCLCPSHDDHHPSFSITDGQKGSPIFKCHRGCSQQAIIDALTARGLWGNGAGAGASRKIIESYDYRDERGRLVFQVCRYFPKDFRQRRPDGVGGWIDDLQGVRRVPYRLDELVAAAEARPGDWRVIIVEGEKDVDKLVGGWGLCATCNPMGAGKWRDEYNQYFKDAEVVIIPDNDQPGRDHAVAVAKALGPVAKVVKVVNLAGLPEKGDVSDWLDAGGSEGELEDLIDATAAFDPDVDEPLVPPGQPEIKSAGQITLPGPRHWLVGNNFCEGYLSGITGAGSTGKTALRIAQLIALATGRSITEERVFRRTKVLLVCLEDDEAELKRRLFAAYKHHLIGQDEVDGWLFYWTPRDLRLLEVDEYGKGAPGGLGDALRRIIRRLGIGLVCVDPFVKSHGANENDNMLIDRAATLFLQVAHDCGCSCDYVHHNRKGINAAGDQDAGRGASALANASRILKTLTKMDKDEAKELGIDEADRLFLIRLEDAKINISAPTDKTVWFKLVDVALSNGEGDWPNGDHVQTVERWHAPSTGADKIPKTEMVAIFDAIRTGPDFALHPNAKDRWLGKLIVKITGLDYPAIKRLIAQWVKNEVIFEKKYTDEKYRERSKVVLNEDKVAAILGGLYARDDTEISQ